MIYADTYLTTLDAIQLVLRLNGVDAADDSLVESHIATATDLITGFCNRSFVPYRETKTFDARGDGIADHSRTLLLRDDLLAVHSLTNGDGTAIASNQYALLGSGYPKWAVELLPSTGLAWTYTTDWQNAISLVGTWGFHADYARAWVSTLDTVKNAGGINATTQSITVTDADGKDARYHTRFAVGQLLRIEDEYLKVIAINTSTNALTVLRGVNGTTAATHAVDKAIDSYAPMRNIEQACISLATWLYRYAPTAGAPIQILYDGTKQIQSDLPKFIEDALAPYQRDRVS